MKIIAFLLLLTLLFVSGHSSPPPEDDLHSILARSGSKHGKRSRCFSKCRLLSSRSRCSRNCKLTHCAYAKKKRVRIHVHMLTVDDSPDLLPISHSGWKKYKNKHNKKRQHRYITRYYRGYRCDSKHYNPRPTRDPKPPHVPPPYVPPTYIPPTSPPSVCGNVCVRGYRRAKKHCPYHWCTITSCSRLRYYACISKPTLPIPPPVLPTPSTTPLSPTCNPICVKNAREDELTLICALSNCVVAPCLNMRGLRCMPPETDPTFTATASPTATSTATATSNPMITASITPSPSFIPAPGIPSTSPVQSPSSNPTTVSPSPSTPSMTPTVTPTMTPTVSPSLTPSPSFVPVSGIRSPSPSSPSPIPTMTVTITPTMTPTEMPTISSTPSTMTPTPTPTMTPTPTPTPPTMTPTPTPTVTPTETPTITPTPSPTPSPTPLNCPNCFIVGTDDNGNRACVPDPGQDSNCNPCINGGDQLCEDSGLDKNFKCCPPSSNCKSVVFDTRLGSIPASKLVSFICSSSCGAKCTDSRPNDSTESKACSLFTPVNLGNDNDNGTDDIMDKCPDLTVQQV